MAWEGVQCCDGRNTAIGAMLCWVQRCSQGATLQEVVQCLKKGCNYPGRLRHPGQGAMPGWGCGTLLGGRSTLLGGTLFPVSLTHGERGDRAGPGRSRPGKRR